MTLDEIRLHRLAGHHLLTPTDTRTAARELCGIQAQYLSHALHGLSIRCGEVDVACLVKTWANRGTMHLILRDDLPLFLHRGRNHFLRSVDTMASDGFVSAERKAYFASMILEGVGRGVCAREALKQLCREAGMTPAEEKSLFDPWGGVIRALCEEGKLCHQVQEQKAFQLCPDFTPMEERDARLELARRYFTHFGPATIGDCAYFFGKPQRQVRKWLSELPVTQISAGDKTFYHLEGGCAINGTLPPCIFLPGFDQLTLGYEKSTSLFLPREHLKEIFAAGGIVRPVVLADGQAVGWWNLKNRRLTVRLFSPASRDRIADAAAIQWPELKSVTFV